MGLLAWSSTVTGCFERGAEVTGGGDEMRLDEVRVETGMT